MIPDANFTLDKAKAHLRVPHADEDALITAMLDAAVAQVESITRRAWTERKWTDVVAPCDLYPCGCDSAVFHARLSPATAKAYAFAPVTVPPADPPDPPIEFPAADLYHSTMYGHTVVRVAGWTAPDQPSGDVGRIDWIAKPPNDEVPADVYAAAMLYLGDLYENRESQVIGTIVAQNAAAALLLRSYVLDLHV